MKHAVAPTESHNSPIPVGDLRARQGAAAAGTGAVVGNECTCGRSRGRSIVRMVGGKREDAPVCSCDGTPAPPPRCCAGAMRKKTTTAGFQNLKILKTLTKSFFQAGLPRQGGMSIAQVAFACQLFHCKEPNNPSCCIIWRVNVEPRAIHQRALNRVQA